jgi:hypothetical protein
MVRIAPGNPARHVLGFLGNFPLALGGWISRLGPLGGASRPARSMDFLKVPGGIGVSPQNTFAISDQALSEALQAARSLADTSRVLIVTTSPCASLSNCYA